MLEEDATRGAVEDKMKLVRRAGGKSVLKITKAEWLALADKYDWMDGPPDTNVQVNEGPVSTSPGGSTLPTWASIRERYSDKEHRHHLRLICLVCGNKETCRCTAPKTEEKGICEECYEKSQSSGKQP